MCVASVAHTFLFLGVFMFETINDKINTLNKWREQGLITEEYNQKLEDLL